MPASAEELGAAFHTDTSWELRPSLKYDALCLMNVLSGDPFYLEYYRADYDRLSPKLGPEERAAFTNLKRKIKDQHGGIVSAMLALYFSAVDAESLDEMIQAARDSAAIQRNLQATPYYSEQGWKQYEEARPDLEAALLALKRIRFDAYWTREIQPVIEQKKSVLEQELPKYNIVPEIEARLGSARPSNKIRVYLLYYSKPHGIKITGMRFLTHTSYPFRIVLRNALHEMMHPPYDLAHDPELAAALKTLQSDRFLMDRVEHHDRSLGYNSFEGLVEEDSVQALEQVIAERFALPRDPRQYWKDQDGGIHVLAVALYSLMKQENFPNSQEAFPTFLRRMILSGRLSNGHIASLYQAFFQDALGTK